MEEWPQRDRDVFYDATLKTCSMAWDGHKRIGVCETKFGLLER
nr:DUF982 domain-containing protein [Shinella lacus]